MGEKVDVESIAGFSVFVKIVMFIYLIVFYTTLSEHALTPFYWFINTIIWVMYIFTFVFLCIGLDNVYNSCGTIAITCFIETITSLFIMGEVWV